MAKIARPPTRKTVLLKIAEFDENGRQWFINTYAVACPAVCHYVRYKDLLYDLKALFASGHSPKIYPKTFTSQQAVAKLRKLGFDCISTNDPEEFIEGKRRLKEINMLERSSAFVKKAKSHYAPICMVCKFDFGYRYGSIGKGFIECHHLDPISGRDGKSKPTKLKDLAMLCANCHRMIHRETPCLRLNELKARLRNSK